MEKKNKTKLFVVSGIVVVCVIILLVLFVKKPEIKTVYETSTVQKGTISSYVTATGTVNPVNKVEVGTQVSGIIDKIYVDYNSTVKKGDLLAEIDRTSLEATLTSAKTELESNKANWEFQEKNFKRIKELYAEKAISDSEYESADYEYKKAKYAYAKSVTSVNSAQINLNYTRITSPIDGIVMSKAVEEGQTVAASFSTPTLFTIAEDLSKMQVTADVDEADIGQVKEGQEVTFTVDAFPDDTFTGTVTQVRLEATTTSNVVTYSVVIDAPNNDLKLMPGLTANVMVCVMKKDNILVIPIKSTRFTPDQTLASDENISISKSAANSQKLAKNQKEVWIKKGSGVTAKIIETGGNDAINYEVKNGLQEGEEVVLSVNQVAVKKEKNGESGRSPFMPQRRR